MVCILYSLGFHSPNFFPEQTGADFELPRYLKFLADYRKSLTVFSGLSHPRVAQTHVESENVFLTGSPVLGSAGGGAAYRNTVSLDQFAASHLASPTRFPTINVGGLSYLPSGARVPGVNRPSELFAKLFLSGNAEQQKQQKRRLKNGQSILDLVADQARDMKRGLPARDSDKLEEYFTSVREAEQRLGTLLEWEDKPKPAPPGPAPKDVSQRDYPFEYLDVMFDLIVLALQHDASRMVTVHSGFLTTQPIFNGAARDFHNLSHHGKLPEKIDELCLLEDEAIKTFAHLLRRLSDVQESGRPLLDHTMVLMGSNLGNSNTHETTNLPILLAGGGFRHGQHLSFSRENNTPLCNLYVSMLQRLGVEVSTFGSGKGALAGLELSPA
ncbi:MAG: DUF1552 domain-containing protein, partial [Planctomycetes bacterium]|nr:DUF1552 domain-containing protein [Planctomycetota bacterium]